MGRLTDTANARIKANRDASMPDWVPILGAVALVVLIGWALVSSLVGGGDPAPVGAPAPAVPQQRPGAGSTPTTGGGGTATTTPDTPTGELIELPNAVGNTVEVPAAAAELARSVAAARVRGDVSAIALVDGATAPEFAATGSRPDVIEVTVSASEDGRHSFVVTVDPDGPGAAASSYIAVTAVDVDGEWRWDPAG